MTAVTLHPVAVDDPEALERALVEWLLRVRDDHRARCDTRAPVDRKTCVVSSLPNPDACETVSDSETI